MLIASRNHKSDYLNETYLYISNILYIGLFMLSDVLMLLTYDHPYKFENI